MVCETLGENIPTVHKCCCCLSLRNGCFLIGVFLVVLSLSDIIFGPKILKPEGNADEKVKKLIAVRNGSNIIIRACSSIELAFALPILYATYKRLAYWIRLITMAFLVYILLFVLVVLLVAIINNNFRFLAASVFWFLLHFYFILVLWSFYKELTRSNESAEDGLRI